MSLFSWVSSAFDGMSTENYSSNSLSSIGNDMFDASLSNNSFDINPATGLPMVDGIGSIDVGGNPYGFDSNSF